MLDNEDLARISLALMAADFAARNGSGGAALHVDVIQAYHEDVLDSFGVSANGWTPNFALDTLETSAERETYWNSLLAAGDPFAATAALFAPIGPAVTATSEANEWRSAVTWAGVEANFTGSHSWGPFDVALDSGGRMIGDGVGSAVIEGTSGNDVLMGFIGSDELLGKGGDDRLYGGLGVDVLVGGEGNDSISGDEGADYGHNAGCYICVR
jgi:Ca2+-binding RTX toxin-like protein